MLSFACKKIELSDLIKCSFGLNRTEYNVMVFLFGKDSLKVEEIAADMGLDRSTVQKAIKGLVSKELVLRKQENLDKGGYVFRYEIRNKHEIKHMILDSVARWHKNVVEEVNNW